MSKASPTLELLRQRIAHKLVTIETMLPPDYYLTLVARHRTNDDAHIIVTAEKQIRDVTEAIEKLYPSRAGRVPAASVEAR